MVADLRSRLMAALSLLDAMDDHRASHEVSAPQEAVA